VCTGQQRQCKRQGSRVACGIFPTITITTRCSAVAVASARVSSVVLWAPDKSHKTEVEIDARCLACGSPVLHCMCRRHPLQPPTHTCALSRDAPFNLNPLHIATPHSPTHTHVLFDSHFTCSSLFAQQETHDGPWQVGTGTLEACDGHCVGAASTSFRLVRRTTGRGTAAHAGWCTRESRFLSLRPSRSLDSPTWA